VAGQSFAGRHDQHLANREAGAKWGSHDASGDKEAPTGQQSGWVDRLGKARTSDAATNWTRPSPFGQARAGSILRSSPTRTLNLKDPRSPWTLQMNPGGHTTFRLHPPVFGDIAAQMKPAIDEEGRRRLAIGATIIVDRGNRVDMHSVPDE
jgi:hypothetical protein